MRRIYAEQRGASGDVEHNKMFRFIDDGESVIFEWGPIGGSKPQRKVITEPDAEKRKAIFDAKLKEKTERKSNPYVIIETEDGGNRVRVESRPDATGRGWGLEVETHSNLDPADIANRMAQRGLRVNFDPGRYFKSDGLTWDVKRDGSCGYEFSSPILRGEAGIFDAKLAVDKIREVCPNAVNTSCGIHVTVSVDDHSEQDLFRLVVGYLKSQEHFYLQCGPSRQDNRYCKRNPVSALQRIGSRSNRIGLRELLEVSGGYRNHDDRYHGLNLTRIFSLKVVEFRMLESTVATRKVGSWIHTCVGFVDGLKKSGVVFNSPSTISGETFDKIVNGTWTR